MMTPEMCSPEVTGREIVCIQLTNPAAGWPAEFYVTGHEFTNAEWTLFYQSMNIASAVTVLRFTPRRADKQCKGWLSVMKQRAENQAADLQAQIDAMGM